MHLICYGTRPELIKLIPLIKKFKECNIKFKTLFSGQHKDLIKGFQTFIGEPDIILDIMEKKQSLNKLVGKILLNMDIIFQKNKNIDKVIIQGDTSTAYGITLSSFHHKKKIIHLEAGLRTFDKYSPFPEEMNRVMISRLADVHLCPTLRSVENLKREDLKDNIFLVGNTIVDMFHNFKIPIEKENYILVTLHRRENRGEKMISMWEQINRLSSKYNFKYITHPSLPESSNILKNVELLEPQNYFEMVKLIKNCQGIISDSGGLQEEAVCAGKKILICRNTTERPETVECGYGKLIDCDIENNIDFLFESVDKVVNPYGNNVCEKIIKELQKF